MMEVSVGPNGLKNAIVQVPDWGERDAGKHYLITEMPSAAAEKWGWRMICLIRQSGARIPENLTGISMVDVAIIGLNVWLQGTITPENLDPLLDQMMSCVKILRNPKRPDIASPLVTDSDVQEVRTRLWLRSLVIELHTGFSPAEALSRLISAIQKAGSSTT